MCRTLSILLLSLGLAQAVGCSCGSFPSAGHSCGDARVDPGEACDDGERNDEFAPDACRTDCRPARCGDGVVDSSEGCDAGADNGAGGCGTECVLVTCGDGTPDAGEECDEGEENRDNVPDACRTNCRRAGCGDGVIDAGEACDDATRNSDVRSGACRTSCALPRCGDGVIDPGEGCDGGTANGTPPAPCSEACVPAHCGDGRLDDGEECDDGEANRDDVPDACRTTCRRAGCGDGVIDAGETCDEGRENSDWRPNACRTTCAPARCGDGAVDTGEACDEGEANSDLAPDACRTACVLPSCGDGVADRGEGCDAGAGNSDSEPGACRTACVPAGCGDTVIDPGETCDDGVANSDTAPGACRLDCTSARCGDGVLDPGEECDPAGPPTETCSASCVAIEPATCFGQPVIDLALHGRSDGAGGYRLIRNSAADPSVVHTACGGAGPDTFFRYPVPADGDLVVELDVDDGVGLDGVVEVLASCDAGNDLGCTPHLEGRVERRDRVLVVPDVRVADGDQLVHVDAFTSFGGPYELYVRVAPPLGAGAVCRLDGTLGRCDPHGATLACIDGDGDGVGTCEAAVPGGVCAEGLAICGTGRDCLLGATSGTCVATCGDGRVEAGEECDDANTVGGDGCSAACRSLGHSCVSPFDLTAVWNAAGGVARWSADGAAFPPKWTDACLRTFTGDAPREAVATFTAPSSGTYEFVLEGTAPNAELAIESGCGGGAVLACASPVVGPLRWAQATLAAGTTVHVVAGFQPEAASTFTLTATRVVCGDGTQAKLLETCDDGNTTGGDGCSAVCANEGGTCATPRTLVWDPVAAEARFEEPVLVWLSRLAGSCGGATSYDAVFAFQAPFAGPWQFRVDTPGLPKVYVLDGACGAGAAELGCGGAPANGQPAVVTSSLAAGQQVYVVVESSSGSPAFAFALTATPAACGDGIPTRYEFCDDGNTLAGDGCDATCHVDRRELEPNDLANQASPLALRTQVGGVLEPAGVDTFRFHALATARYSVEVWMGEIGKCFLAPGTYSDLRLRLQDVAGHPLAEDEDGGLNNCPGLTFRAPATGDYLLVVERKNRGAEPIPYWVELKAP